jgi:FkbM family methyltransferase
MKFWQGSSDCPAYCDLLAQQRGRLAFDVGANGGFVTGMFAGGFEKVVALEPAEESFERLQATEGQRPNVVALQMAVSRHVGEVTLTVAAEAIESGQLVTADPVPESWGEVVDQRSVPCTTLDALTTRFGSPDLVKIDVEGHEDLVMDGATKLIAGRATKWMIEHHSPSLKASCTRKLQEAGYTVRVHAHTGYPEGSAEREHHGYLIAEPPERKRRARWRASSWARALRARVRRASTS